MASVTTGLTGREPGHYSKRLEAGNRTVRPAFLTSAPSHFDSSLKRSEKASPARVSRDNIHETTGTIK